MRIGCDCAQSKSGNVIFRHMRRFDLASSYRIDIFNDASMGVANLLFNDARLAMNRLWRIIESEHAAFVRDAKRTGRRAEWSKPFPERLTPATYAFQDRSTARAISIINLVWLLNGIVSQAYNELVASCNRHMPNSSGEPAVVNGDRRLRNRLPLLTHYRHKLTGHGAAYAKSPGDPPLHRLTSLLVLNGSGPFVDEPLKFSMGGLQYTQEGSNTPDSAFREPFRLTEQFVEIEKYFEEWDQLIGGAFAHYRRYLPLQTGDLRIVFRDLTKKKKK